jgi:hypothetical protein
MTNAKEGQGVKGREGLAGEEKRNEEWAEKNERQGQASLK